MPVTIPSTPAPTSQALEQLAAIVAEPLPESYLAFVQKHDGAEPESNIIDLGSDDSSGVRRFISVAEASSASYPVDGFPRSCIPLAEDDCGNYFYLSLSSGQVFFWDHEIEGGDQLLANDLPGFLNLLRPFDDSSVKLTPGQVLRVWTRPGFKPEF